MKKYPEPTVGAIILNPEGLVLLCRSKKWGDKYVFPGGHIELGEKMEDALRKEVMEETGQEIFDIELISLQEAVSATYLKPNGTSSSSISFAKPTHQRLSSTTTRTHLSG